MVAGICIVGITASAWQLKQDTRQDTAEQHHEYQPGYADTSEPDLRSRGDSFQMQDLDAAMREVNKAMEKVNEQMKNLDMQKMNEQINEALKKVDFEQINKQVELAMKQVDMEKINKEIQASLKEVDMQKINARVKAALEQAKDEMAKVNTKKIEEQMKSLKDQLDSKEFKLKIDSLRIGEQVQKAMAEARGSLEKAKKELQNYKDFTNELEKDGLIDKSKPYTLELKDGYLYINGQKQSKETTDKYRKYYNGKDHFKISMNEADHHGGEGL